jgi:UDP-glucose 4-epimerase
MARILVTGAKGFIGSHLVARHLAQGDVVDALVRRGWGGRESLSGDARIHEVALDSADALLACLAEARPDVIYHLAVRTRRPARPDLSDAISGASEDLLNLLTILSAAARSPQPPRTVVRAGTLAEYGPAREPCDERQREAPRDAYSATAVAGTHFAQMLAPRLPFRLITARLSLVYGGGQSNDFLIPDLIRRCLLGQPSTIQRPDDRRDLLHVDDAVDALCLLGKGTAAVDLVNICSGVAPTMREVGEIVIEATGADPSLVTFARPMAPGLAQALLPAADLAADRLAWRARIGLAEGIARTVRAMRQEMASEGVGG